MSRSALAVQSKHTGTTGLRNPATPILRWQGSKRVVAGTIASALGPISGRYIEPFLGSASVFLALNPSEALLSDRIEPLITTYRTVTENSVAVSKRLSTLTAQDPDYYFVRDRWHPADPIDRAAQFIYLNAHCFNGLYRTNRKGAFNVPVGSRAGRVPTAVELRDFARRMATADLRAIDAWTALGEAKRGDLVYLDPPYPTERPNYGEYGYHEFGREQWARLLAEELPRLNRAGVSIAISMPPALGASISVSLEPHMSVVAQVKRYRAGGTQASSRAVEALVLIRTDPAVVHT